MYILGTNWSSHDTSAAIIKDGKVLFAVEEERLNGEKHTRQSPINAVKACLEFAGITINKVDAVVLSFVCSDLVQKRYLNYWIENYPAAEKRMLSEMGTARDLLDAEKHIRETLNFKGEIYSCRHHISHMAGAYFVSGFNKSALFSIDGVGEIESSMIGMARGNKIEVFENNNVNWPHSIGGLYTAITDYLGFIPHCDEGKVMGLAPYGNINTYKKVFDQMITLTKDGKFQFDLDFLNYPFQRHSHMSNKFIKLCGQPRKPKEKITQRHMDIAASLQDLTEKTMIHIAKNLYKLTKTDTLCLSGGVALNCVANGKILKRTPFKKIFVQPSSNDAGTAIGSALHYYYQKRPTAKRYKMEHSYLGHSYSDRLIEQLLKKRRINFLKTNNASSMAANYLSKGKILAWFNGRMEFGPRALGNRSILTAPFPAEMKDTLNKRVKKREGFRPFAPIVLAEDCDKYFDESYQSPFMLLTYNVLDKQKNNVPAITHIDGTARVQTLTSRQNPELYKLIKQFKKLTGVSVILNTSFNVMGQPIVCSPEQALDSFLSTDIDYLVLNAKYIIDKKLT